MKLFTPLALLALTGIFTLNAHATNNVATINNGACIADPFYVSGGAATIKQVFQDVVQELKQIQKMPPLAVDVDVDEYTRDGHTFLKFMGKGTGFLMVDDQTEKACIISEETYNRFLPK